MEDRPPSPETAWADLQFRKPLAVADNNWLAAIALQMVFFVVVAVAQTAAEPGAGSMLLARAFAAALFPTLLLAWVIRAGSKAFIAGHVLALWFVIGAMVAAGAKVATHRAMGEQMVDTIEGFLRSMPTGEVLADVTPVADTAEARGIAMLAQLLVDSTKANRRYLNALKDAGWDRVLDPRALSATGGIDRSQARIEAASKALDTYSEDVHALIREIERNAATRDIPASMAEQFRESALGPRLETAIRQERDIIDASTVVVGVLAKHRPEFDGAAWMFRKESELIEFREAVAALDAAVDTQARQQAAVRDQAEKRLAELRGTAD